MSITNFISAVKTNGIARVNRYEAIVPFPSYTASATTAQIATLFCDAVTLPGVNLATVPQKQFGEIREFPYEKMFDTVQLSFYVDTAMNIRTAFDKWMAMIVDPFTRTIGYYRDYTRNMDIHVRTIDDRNAFTIRLFEVYPKTVQSIQLDASSRDIMKMQVTMQYKYWMSYNNGDSSISPLIPMEFGRQDPQSIFTATGYPLELPPSMMYEIPLPPLP